MVYGSQAVPRALATHDQNNLLLVFIGRLLVPSVLYDFYVSKAASKFSALLKLLC